MERGSRFRPSPALAVAIVALAVALSGTAVAATNALVSGDSLIKPNSLSGNRLKNHTVTGTQVNLAKLGKVPKAAKADTAKTATTATSAGSATNATNATHASTADTATNATNATNAASAASLTPLASGHSESGFYTAAAGATGWVGQGITYTQPLSTPIDDGNIIWNKAGATSSHCSGLGHADQGYLCLYDNEESPSGITTTAFYSTGFSSPSVGAILYWYLPSAGFVSGEYTVTAP